MVRGDHRGKTCQGPYHDPNHDADSRSVVPPEVPKDVRWVSPRAVRRVRTIRKGRSGL